MAHQHPLAVAPGDIDHMGHVNNAVYLSWVQDAVVAYWERVAPAEAVAKANNSPFGLSAGIWTEKGSLILQVASQLRAGVVWANTFNKFDPTSPFGGYKESGYGREGGRHGLEAYLAV